MTVDAVTVHRGIVEAFRASLPVERVPQVSAFDGEFDLDTLKRYIVRAPCVLVSLTGGETIPRGSATLRDDLHVSAFIVAAGGTFEQRTHTALTIRARLLETIFKLNIAGVDYRVPKSVQTENHYGVSADKTGFTLWELKWVTSIDATPVDGFADPDELLRIWIDYTRSSPNEGMVSAQDDIEFPRG